MERILITPPDQDVISLDEMKAHLRVDTNDQDDLIEGFIDSVLSTVDPALGGVLGRALRPQTWELQLDGFPHGGAETARCMPRSGQTNADQYRIDLPFPPLIAVVSVKYDDTGGAEQTLAAGTGYVVLGQGGRSRQAVAPPYLGYWPLARPYPGSVRIRFQSGYPLPDDDTEDPLPGGIKAYIKLMVADLFSVREANQVARASLIENPNFARLLDPHRVF